MKMTDFHWKPQPDYNRLLRTLRRQGRPDDVPFFELGADPEMVSAVLGEPARWRHFTDQKGTTRASAESVVEQAIRYQLVLGYDTVGVGAGGLGLRDLYTLESHDSAALERDKRRWVDEHAGIITSWADFERYPWPRAADASLWGAEYVSEHLPDGMGMIAGTGGIYEPVVFLMGYETLALALYDQPDLVQAMFDRIAEIYVPPARALAQMDGVVALLMTDDMGYKTGPMIAPDHLRRYVFPIQKQFAQIAHENGLPFILHACGNLEVVMDDLIDDVGVDAKHSYEDAIEPVESFTARYADRIAVLGGVDMDLLSRGTEEQVRARTRHILETCAPTGAYALGTGNTVSNYLPVGNFLAMLDEGWRFRSG